MRLSSQPDLVLPWSEFPRGDRIQQPAQGKSAPARLVGQSIVCFAKDFDEDPTSNNHVMQLLAQNNRVLWLNSIATRSPNLRSSRDFSKIVRKLRSFFAGPKHIAAGLWVYTPVVLPFPGSRIAAVLNTWILRLLLWMTRRRLGIDRFQLWVFIPTAARFVGRLGESLLVYYVTDEYSKFSHVDEAVVAENDQTLCRKADVIFATAQRLVDKRQILNRETYLSRHGVDHDLFATALDESTVVPADLATLPGPVLGFYGSLQQWIDYDLIEFLARRNPGWSIVLLGKELVDLSPLRRLRNVHLLGRKPHQQLPAYCKGFSVGLIPHRVNELTLHMNPIKLREYLSAGLPVVSVNLPEVAAYGRYCRIAANYEEFEASIRAVLQSDTSEARRERSGAMRGETWHQRVEEIERIVARAQFTKSPR